jgi:hypothetical protein
MQGATLPSPVQLLPVAAQPILALGFGWIGPGPPTPDNDGSVGAEPLPSLQAASSEGALLVMEALAIQWLAVVSAFADQLH